MYRYRRSRSTSAGVYTQKSVGALRTSQRAQMHPHTAHGTVHRHGTSIRQRRGGADHRLVDGVPEASLTGTHWAQHSTGCSGLTARTAGRSHSSVPPVPALLRKTSCRLIPAPGRSWWSTAERLRTEVQASSVAGPLSTRNSSALSERKQRPACWTCHGDPICMTASCGWWSMLCPVLTSSCAQRNYADTYGSIVGI
jgi:hypothetical protein